jgi:hypothetical protein
MRGLILALKSPPAKLNFGLPCLAAVFLINGLVFQRRVHSLISTIKEGSGRRAEMSVRSTLGFFEPDMC